MKINKFMITLFALTCMNNTFAMQNIFYFIRSNNPSIQPIVKNELADLKNHYQKINSIITQAYQIDENGNVTGYLNDEMMNFARSHHIKVIAMVTNARFKTGATHRFLSNSRAQDKAIKLLIQFCDSNHLDGMQIDFESIHIKDKNILTKFLINSAQALHQHHYNVSFAVVPALASGEQASVFQQKKYNNWSGAYDLAALAKAADFITIMTYDQHLQGTTPGPYAGFRWVEAALKHTMKYVPTNKISLGIPSFSGFWYTGGAMKKISVHTDEISFEVVKSILKKNHADLRWDNFDKVHYAIFDHNWLYQYIYVEDAESFASKVNLAKKYNLHGISVFSLGNEDPATWRVL